MRLNERLATHPLNLVRQVVVWDLEAGTKRGATLIEELEHAKNVRYHVSKDGMQVHRVWCVLRVGTQ
jgi:hypothetical protein